MADTHISCKALVLHCIDFRFQQIMNGYFDTEFPQGYDLVSVAGGVKGIVEGSEFLLNQIETSCKLHHPENIILLQHEDCGAYGGSEKLGDTEEEFQKEQLEKAATKIQSQYPDLKIQKHFVKLSGKFTKV